jgi:hypothetical protein
MKKQIIKYSAANIEPERSLIFEAQGIGPEAEPSPVVYRLYESGVELFMKLVQPIGIIQGITGADFARVYEGEGKNEKDTPLEHIYPRAANLALFSATLGEKVGLEISRLLDGGDFALGYMLDSVASFCADKASRIAEEFFLKKLIANGQTDGAARALNYSPGYCGWHISGQGKLFSYLHPEEIGIVLNKSYLMTPLKSISGVLAAGDRSVHYFKNDYPFCRDCRTRTCRSRLKIMR